MNYGAGELSEAVIAYLQSNSSSSSSSSRGGGGGGGESYADVAEAYAVPVSTLKAHVAAISCGGQLKRPGRPSVLAADDEAWLTKWAKHCASVNMPLGKRDILKAAAQIAERRAADGDKRQRSFAGLDGKPGKNWYRNFMKRAGLRSKHVKRVEPGRPTRAEYEEWLGKLTMLIAEKGLRPNRIFNADESGLDRRYGKRAYVVVEKNKKATMVAAKNTIKDHVTVIATICANGTHLPSLWITKGDGEIKDKHAQEMLDGTMPGSCVVATSNGWVNFPSWSQYLQFFVKNMPRERPATVEDPVLLILDGHRTRFSVRCLQYAMEHGVIVFLLPPHMTDTLQPLDVGIFGPFKVSECECRRCCSVAVRCVHRSHRV
jgi:hypothetical protein